jgi:hypothetical protein
MRMLYMLMYGPNVCFQARTLPTARLSNGSSGEADNGAAPSELTLARYKRRYSLPYGPANNKDPSISDYMNASLTYVLLLLSTFFSDTC